MKQHDDVVTLDTCFKSGMSVKTVQNLSWSSDPDFLAERMTVFWKKYWGYDRLPDLDYVDKVFEPMPQLQPFDPTIPVQELHECLKKLKPRKARGCDGFSNRELSSISPGLASMLLSLLNAFTFSGQ